MPPPQYQVKHLEDQKIVDVVKDNITIGQHSMKGLGVEKSLGQGITLKRRNGPKGMAMERDMVLGTKKRWINPTSQMGLRVKLIILSKDQEGMVSISQ